MNPSTHRGIVDVRGARVILSRFMLPLEIEQAGIINAYGRTLAEDIVTDTPLPSHALAARDGYAVIAADTVGATRQAPASLSILSHSPAKGKRLERGMTMAVRRDQPLPDDADAVVESPDTFRPDNGPKLLVLSEYDRGTNVVQSGSTAPAGHVFLCQGTVISGCEMELIASLGLHGVPVRRKPRIAVVTSGASVVDVLGEMQPGETRNTARYGLVGSLLEAGCDLGRLIHAREGRLGLERAISQCHGCDAVIVCIGPQEKHDSALEAISASGQRHFDRVQMEPGTCGFGVACDRPVFVTESRSSLEAFEAIIRPGLMMMLGRSDVDRPRVTAALGATLKLNSGSAHFARAITARKDGAWTAKPITDRPREQCLNQCPNSLILIPENVSMVKRGEAAEVMML